MEDRTKAYFKLTTCIIFFSLELIFCSISSIEITPSFSINSYSFGIDAKFEITPNFFIYHKNNFFKTNYPFERPVIFQKVRNNSTGVNEQSYLSINDYKKKINIWFGRRYLDSGQSVISGLFISPESPAVDNLSYQLKLSDKIKLQSNIIRLDSRKNPVFGVRLDEDHESDDHTVYMYFNRWYYHHRIELKYNDFLTIGFKEAVVSTGQNRPIEWYYLLPLGPFHAEQLNQEGRIDGLYNVGSSSGIGNNDNGMAGLDISLLLGENILYGEFCIDEFQVDKEDRKKMQDVFGLLIGFRSINKNIDWSIEYAYASPWLYLNRGKFSSPEINGVSLGLRSPNFQSLSIKPQFSFKSYKIGLNTQLWIQGSQSLDTDWDAWENKIDYFDFNDFKVENRYRAFILSENKNNQYEFGFSYNWLYEGSMQIYCSVAYQIKN